MFLTMMAAAAATCQPRLRAASIAFGIVSAGGVFTTSGLMSG